MIKQQLLALSLIIVLAADVGGCAASRCAPEYCASDAKITEDVRAAFKGHPEFGPPALLKVNTINGIVYLYGQVDTSFVSQNMESLVNKVPNVKGVVNQLNVGAVGH
jgi:osmotically-inducible protein OsmY